jgi:hypothetical protein
MIGFALSHLGFLGILAGLCLLLGHSLLKRFKFASPLERAVFEFSTGSGILGLLAFALIACGRFTPGYLLIITFLAAIPAVIDFLHKAGSRLKESRFRLSLRTASYVAVAGLLALPIVGLALYPPTAWDATMYHLPIARTYAEHHSLVWNQDIRVAFFPQLGETLDSVALLLFDDVTAQLLQTSMLMAVAAGAFCLAGNLAGQAAGLWAALLWLSNPLALAMGTAAMTDVQATLFAFLGIVAYLRWKEMKSPGWACLSGALLGFAAATKYLGLIPLAIVGLLFCAASLPRRECRAPALFLLVALLVSLPWYGRTFLLTGNPTYPFLTSLWGNGHGALTAAEISAYRRALVAWPAEVVGGNPQTQWIRRLLFLHSPFRLRSPIFLVLLPALTLAPFAVRRFPSTRHPAFIAGLYWLAWAVSFPDPRYLMPAFPLLAVVAATGLKAVFDRFIPSADPAKRKILAAGIAAIILLPALAFCFTRLIARGAIPSDTAGRTRYLSKVEGYAALDFLNRNHGSDYVLYALYSERLVYYCRGRWEGDWFGRYRYDRITSRLASREELVGELRLAGAGYFLVDEGRFRQIHGRAFPITEGIGFRLIYRDAFSKLFEVEPAFR